MPRWLRLRNAAVIVIIAVVEVVVLIVDDLHDLSLGVENDPGMALEGDLADRHVLDEQSLVEGRHRGDRRGGGRRPAAGDLVEGDSLDFKNCP